MRVVTWNVLADLWMRLYGDYSYVLADLKAPGGRRQYIMSLLEKLSSQEPLTIFALQEVDIELAQALRPRWLVHDCLPGNELIGLAIVTPYGGFNILTGAQHDMLPQYSAQILKLSDGLQIVNAHLRYAPADTPSHPGVRQLQGILSRLQSGPVVLLADSNDRPGGPIRKLLEKNGFSHTAANKPTAFINGQPAALDLIVARGAQLEPLPSGLKVEGIPTHTCPSDHLPVMAELTMG